MDTLHIIILGFAVWRGTSLLSSERGPFDMFEKLRTACGVHYTKDNHGYESPQSDRQLGKLISCPYCISVWLGAIASVLYITFGIVAVWLALPLALSALALLLNSIIER